MSKYEIEVDEETAAQIAQIFSRYPRDTNPADIWTIILHDGINRLELDAETPESIAEWERERAMIKEHVDTRRRIWEDATLPDVRKSAEALLKDLSAFEEQLTEKGGKRRSMRFLFDETDARVWAWVALVQRARRRKQPVGDLRIDLENPAHRAAAREHVRCLLENDFHLHYEGLEQNDHYLLLNRD